MKEIIGSSTATITKSQKCKHEQKRESYKRHNFPSKNVKTRVRGCAAEVDADAAAQRGVSVADPNTDAKTVSCFDQRT